MPVVGRHHDVGAVGAGHKDVQVPERVFKVGKVVSFILEERSSPIWGRFHKLVPIPSPTFEKLAVGKFGVGCERLA